MPDGIGLSMDYNTVNLQRNTSVDFNISYTASLTSPANGKVVFHTTGGDLTFNFDAKKQVLPQGALFEGFEEYFPPAGWTSTNWGYTTTSIEGDRSADCDGGYGKSYLRSPRIDLTDGGKVTFTFLNRYDGEEFPEYDIELHVSYDGGTNWMKKWDTSTQPLNEIKPLQSTSESEAMKATSVGTIPKWKRMIMAHSTTPTSSSTACCCPML